MNMMNDLLGEYFDKFVLVFLDDVLVYSANPQDHAVSWFPSKRMYQ